MHNNSEIEQNQLLLVRFQNLGSDDLIVPGTVNLSFNIGLSSTPDPNRELVSNVGRVIVKKLAVKFEGNEILGVDDFDVLPATETSERQRFSQVKVLQNLCGTGRSLTKFSQVPHAEIFSS